MNVKVQSEIGNRKFPDSREESGINSEKDLIMLNYRLFYNILLHKSERFAVPKKKPVRSQRFSLPQMAESMVKIRFFNDIWVAVLLDSMDYSENIETIKRSVTNYLGYLLFFAHTNDSRFAVIL